jgi:hypothetical protein
VRPYEYICGDIRVAFVALDRKWSKHGSAYAQMAVTRSIYPSPVPQLLWHSVHQFTHICTLDTNEHNATENIRESRRLFDVRCIYQRPLCTQITMVSPCHHARARPSDLQTDALAKSDINLDFLIHCFHKVQDLPSLNQLLSFPQTTRQGSYQLMPPFAQLPPGLRLEPLVDVYELVIEVLHGRFRPFRVSFRDEERAAERQRDRS